MLCESETVLLSIACLVRNFDMDNTSSSSMQQLLQRHSKSRIVAMLIGSAKTAATATSNESCLLHFRAVVRSNMLGLMHRLSI